MAFTSETVRLFLAVLDHGSFSAAARALGRVPSAVSMGIANLEAELDLVPIAGATNAVRLWVDLGRAQRPPPRPRRPPLHRRHRRRPAALGAR